jgi:coproporphyrinogen III oxidase-like Fe-S oxidoreductase
MDDSCAMTEAASSSGMSHADPGFGLDVHWPFCRAICPSCHFSYCNFSGHVTGLADADIECLIQGWRMVTPRTQRSDRLIDLLEQIRGGGRQDAGPL